VVSPQTRREAVLVMQVEVELSQRRACGLMELYRATCRYRRRRGEDQNVDFSATKDHIGYSEREPFCQKRVADVN
jgi:hypothetical protein